MNNKKDKQKIQEITNNLRTLCINANLFATELQDLTFQFHNLYQYSNTNNIVKSKQPISSDSKNIEGNLFPTTRSNQNKSAPTNRYNSKAKIDHWRSKSQSTFSDNISPDNDDDFIERIICINVGGEIFHTKLSTLANDKNCCLYTHLNKALSTKNRDGDDEYFIDSDPTYFGYILDFLRDGTFSPKQSDNLEEIFKLALYYNILSLASRIKHMIIESLEKQNSAPCWTDKNHKLLTGVAEEQLLEDFDKLLDDYYFENWKLNSNDNSKIDLALYKPLSQGEIRLIDRLQRFMN